MNAERAWFAIWVTVFLPALVGLCGAFLPAYPAVRLAVAPVWMAWWTLTAGPSLGAWVAVWGGALLEWAWTVPPGACVLPLLALWGAGRWLKESLPAKLHPWHGAFGGLILVPLLWFWLWLYAALWVGVEAAAPLRPGLGFLLSPLTGALGGGAVFALARACDFRALAPEPEEEDAHAS